MAMAMTNEAYYKCDVTIAGARREILNRRDRRYIKKGCVTLFKSFLTTFDLFFILHCLCCPGRRPCNVLSQPQEGC